MPLILSKEMSALYEKERVLLIKDFLPLSPFNLLLKTVEHHLAGQPKDFEHRYKTGRDLFRINIDLKKSLLKKDTQKVLCDLCKVTKLHFAFDQTLDLRTSDCNFEASTLQEIMSISPLALGGMLCLEGENVHPFFPKKANELLLFDPLKTIEWNEMPKGLYLLFGCAPQGALYKENIKDLNTYLVKHLHYQHNQPIEPKTHPFLKG